MLCVCPLGKEYPVAPGTADATGWKEGSSIHGRGTRKVIFNPVPEALM